MEPQPKASMRRTPPGGPHVAVAFAEPEERASWFQRLVRRLRLLLGPG
jgi:hypothetical protein